jgi:hypothetical protein
VYDSRETLVARLEKVRAEIDNARSLQSFSADQGTTFTRPNLKALLEEEQSVLSRIEALDARSGGGMFNRARFR